MNTSNSHLTSSTSKFHWRGFWLRLARSWDNSARTGAHYKGPQIAFSKSLVIDANRIYESVVYFEKSRRDPNSLPRVWEAVDAGTIELHAPTWLREEVAEHLHDRCQKTRIPIDKAERRVQELFSKIKFHEVFVPKHLQETADDPDDLAYILLSEKLYVPIWTKDTDLKRMGAKIFPQEADPVLRDLARAQTAFFAPLVALVLGGVLVSQLGLWIIGGCLAIATACAVFGREKGLLGVILIIAVGGILVYLTYVVFQRAKPHLRTAESKARRDFPSLLGWLEKKGGEWHEAGRRMDILERKARHILN